jgi:hypothetical protein
VKVTGGSTTVEVPPPVMTDARGAVEVDAEPGGVVDCWSLEQPTNINATNVNAKTDRVNTQRPTPARFTNASSILN